MPRRSFALNLLKRHNPDMCYENPFYFVEDAGAADLISDGRLQLGVSRGSPEQVIDGWRHFGYTSADDDPSGANAARQKAELILQLLEGEGFAEPNPRPMFPNPPGLLRLEPHSEGLRERMWWGAGSDATAVWAAEHGMNLMSSTLKDHESNEPFHVQQAKQLRAFRDAWDSDRWGFEPRTSVSRSIFAITNDTDRRYFVGGDTDDQIGKIDANTTAIFGRSYADEPEALIEQLRHDEAIAEADTLLLTVPNQLGVAFCVHILESFAKYVAPELGWKPNTAGPVVGDVI
ncbi:LLM class flavin-dependent oxidoreductase [Microbacterium amylolyticum]|nr:LLM class flavin-dependent oxidoreductase [Microbacterium amylolyticum]